MPSTFTNSLRLVKQAAGENNNTWGTLFNQQFADLADTAIAGFLSVALADANTTLTASNGASDQARNAALRFTGALTAQREIVVPTASKLYVIHNSTSGGFGLNVKTSGGSGIVVPNGSTMFLLCDGINVVDAITALSSGATVGGQEIGFMDVPQNSISADYTLVLSDRGKHIYHPPSDTSSRIWTIPANASVAYRIGTAITLVNDAGAGAITLQITSDTLVFAGTGATGSRTLNAASVATLLKVNTTRWIISGTGIS